MRWHVIDNAKASYTHATTTIKKKLGKKEINVKIECAPSGNVVHLAPHCMNIFKVVAVP